MFRVGNMRRSHLLEAHVRAQLVQKVGNMSYSFGYSIYFQAKAEPGTECSTDSIRASQARTFGASLSKLAKLCVR